MANTKSEFGSSREELDKLFDMDDEKREKIAGIKTRVTMPNPEVQGDRLNVRVLYYKGLDGGVELYKTVSGEKFRTPAMFLNVEEMEMPGIEKDLNVSKSLYQEIDRELNNRGLTWDELPGKVLAVTASYWTSAPRDKRGGRVCVKCSGKGCTFCVITGAGDGAGQATGLMPPTLYGASIMDNVGNSEVKESGKDFVESI